jgi:hydroxyethylthiazole kinase-like uncharacterized protein yjeF
MIAIDRKWLRAHPLPPNDDNTDKNERGRVLAVGGSRVVPGALRLTGEAALRAGAGKLQLATIAELAPLLGMTIPEAAVIALADDDEGEIGAGAAAGALAKAAESCDTLILGPGMGEMANGEALVTSLLRSLGDKGSAVLDAAAIAPCSDCEQAIRSMGGRVVLTPHIGEMAALTGRDADWIEDHMEEAAGQVASDLNVVVVLKAAKTVISSRDSGPLIYSGGGPGLATGGSGDVLGGILGGLLARGADPVIAAAWAVWVHGEAGRRLTERLGGPGLLARELTELVPQLLHAPAVDSD